MCLNGSPGARTNADLGWSICHTPYYSEFIYQSVLKMRTRSVAVLQAWELAPLVILSIRDILESTTPTRGAGKRKGQSVC